MDILIWAIITTVLSKWIFSLTNKEHKLYEKTKTQITEHKYKIVSEFIGSIFIIFLSLSVIVPLFQSGENIVTAIFLCSSYTLISIICTHVIISVICKVKNNCKYDGILFVIAIRSHISYKRMLNILFFIFIASCCGIIYSTIRILICNL